MEVDWLDIEARLQDAYDLLSTIQETAPQGHKVRLLAREAKNTTEIALLEARADIDAACEKLDAK